MPIEIKSLNGINNDNLRHESHSDDVINAQNYGINGANLVLENSANGDTSSVLNSGLRVETDLDKLSVPSSSSSILSSTSPNIVAQGPALGLRCQKAGTSLDLPTVTGPLSINAVCQAAARSGG